MGIAVGPQAVGVVRFVGVSKRYRRGVSGDGATVDAAADLDVTFGPDEAVGIVGPNGAGKTTLLRLAAGITTPDRGRVERRGRLAALIELGLGFHPDLTGAENVRFGGLLLGMTRRELERRHAAIVEFSGLGDDIGRPTKHYSSGMLARLGFAIAANADVDVLLVDEVLSVGDEAFQRQCLDALADVRRRGALVVLVSHDLFTISQICDRVLLVDHGRVVRDGSPGDVVPYYLGLGGEHSSGPIDVSIDVLAPGWSATDQHVRVRVDAVVRRPAPGAACILSLVMPVNPLSVVDPSETEPLRIAECPIDVDLPTTGGMSSTFDIDLTSIFPGRFQLQLAVHDAHGDEVALALCDLVVPGDPPRRSPALRLDASWRVDA